MLIHFLKVFLYFSWWAHVSCCFIVQDFVGAFECPFYYTRYYKPQLIQHIGSPKEVGQGFFPKISCYLHWTCKCSMHIFFVKNRDKLTRDEFIFKLGYTLPQETMSRDDNLCSGRCKAVVRRIVEQVRIETEQWSQMQEMLGQVRKEMEELQASRDFWEDRALKSDYQIQSLRTDVRFRTTNPCQVLCFCLIICPKIFLVWVKLDWSFMQKALFLVSMANECSS